MVLAMRVERFLISSVLSLSIALSSSTAFADYECIAENVQGAAGTESPSQKVSATFYNRYFQRITMLDRVLEFGPRPDWSRARLHLRSNGPLAGFVRPAWLSTDFTYIRRPAAKALFAFLVLDSGQHVSSLVRDAQGRTWFGSIEGKSFRAADRVYASFQVNDADFVTAFDKAKTLVLELKYADGETMVRETFDVTRPDQTIEQTLSTVAEMHKEIEKRCKIYQPELEF